MPTKLTSKGQVTVPKPVRDYLGLHPGSGVTFERLPDGDVVIRPEKKRTKVASSAFAKLRGRATVRMKTHEILARTRM